MIQPDSCKTRLQSSQPIRRELWLCMHEKVFSACIVQYCICSTVYRTNLSTVGSSEVSQKQCLCRMMRRGGGIRFYTENQNTSLLFWSFAAFCMHATVSIQFPQFERDDVNNPMFTGTRSDWYVSIDRDQ